MGSNLSVAQMLAELEGKIRHHRERQEFHAQQEVHHREQAVLHAAELETSLERFEAFKTAAAAAGELVERHLAANAPPPPQEEEELPDPPDGKRRPVSQLIAHVVEDWAPEGTFSATAVAREVNRRLGARLRRPLDSRSVSVTLRRLAAGGQLQIVRKGSAHRETLYSRTRPAAPRSR